MFQYLNSYIGTSSVVLDRYVILMGLDLLQQLGRNHLEKNLNLSSIRTEGLVSGYYVYFMDGRKYFLRLVAPEKRHSATCKVIHYPVTVQGQQITVIIYISDLFLK